MLPRIPPVAVRAAYRLQQASFRYGLVSAHAALRKLIDRRRRAPSGALTALEESYQELLSRDLENVERGVYPASLLFQIPLGDYARTLPRFLLDLRRVYARFRRGAYDDVPEDLDLRRYPAYFRRAFHWQTDGYLSRRSADLYDLGVEFLFMGCADVMRRQVIPPMARFAKSVKRRPLRILDVGCGTGRTLSQIATALPDQRYFGIDLSGFYVETAREHLAGTPDVNLVTENAEKLPFRDEYFDIVTSVFVLHELPRKTRRNVLAEALRVLRPGGLLVIEDSAQLSDAPDLAFFFEGFADDMHEPFYRDYVRDGLEALLARTGFCKAETERCWLSKVVSAHKPRAPRARRESARRAPSKKSRPGP